jgi:hypothetical protein
MRKTFDERSITNFEDSVIREHCYDEKTIEHIYEHIKGLQRTCEDERYQMNEEDVVENVDYRRE